MAGSAGTEEPEDSRSTVPSEPAPITFISLWVLPLPLPSVWPLSRTLTLLLGKGSSQDLVAGELEHRGASLHLLEGLRVALAFRADLLLVQLLQHFLLFLLLRMGKRQPGESPQLLWRQMRANLPSRTDQVSPRVQSPGARVSGLSEALSPPHHENTRGAGRGRGPWGRGSGALQFGVECLWEGPRLLQSKNLPAPPCPGLISPPLPAGRAPGSAWPVLASGTAAEDRAVLS